MNAADVFAALWKQKKIIALIVAIALLVCHLFLFVGQTYTASVYIKFLEGNASDGLANDGSKLDPYEISEPFIVGEALERMGAGEKKVSDVAQRIKVTPVISSAEQEKYASWIDQFADYENTEEEKQAPVYYKVEFESKEGSGFAKSFLSTLIQQYRAYYTEKYHGFNQVAVISEAVVKNSDYLYSVELLQTQISETATYLRDVASGDMDYRSPKTGYSLTDLADAYDLLTETGIAPVTQYILDAGISKDVSTLVAGLQQDAYMAQKESDENAEKATTQEQLMLLYAEKNKEYVSTVISPEAYDTQVYGDVERDRAYLRDFTTYDQMMFDYVEYAAKSADLLIDKAHINKNLSKFGNSAATASAPVGKIADIYEQYALLTGIAEETLAGYNAFKSGKVILQVCGIRTAENLPELLYYAVSGVLALCVGCGVLVACELKKTREENEAERTSPERVV